MGKIISFIILISFLVYAQPKNTGSVFNVTNYGISTNGTTDATSGLTTIAATISNSTTKKTLYFPSGEYRINSNLTLDTNITLRLDYNAKLQVADTLTIQGFIEAGAYQIFSGSGTVLVPHSKVYPEWFGAKGDGIIDNVTALTRTFNSTSPEIELNGSIYNINSKIENNLQGRDLTITSNNSKIYSSATVVDNDPKILEGGIHFYNGNVVNISNVTFQGDNNGTENYLNALVIDSCNNISLNKVKAENASFSGIRIRQANYLSVIDCNSSNNLYAGLLVENVGAGNIRGGIYDSNGVTLGGNGYGIAFSHRNGSLQDNTGFEISGVTANYNMKDGIDVHGGVGMKIIGNHVKGFGTVGIRAINEAGEDPDVPGVLDTSWYKYVRDNIISENTIENDSAWFVAHTPNLNANGMGIAVGNWGDNTLGCGSFIVSNNILRHLNVPYARAHIVAFTNQFPSVQPDEIKIVGNQIFDAGVSHYWSDGAITVLGDLPAKSIDISGNTIIGTGDSCITVMKGDQVFVTGNKIIGTFQYPIATAGDSLQRITNNLYNGLSLPDMISQGEGTLVRRIQTENAADTISTMTVNANGYPLSASKFTVKISTEDFTNLFNGSFTYEAYAYNDTSNVAHFGIVEGESVGLLSDPALFKPTVAWAGAGDERTLTVICPTHYMTYHVNVDFTSRSLQPYYKGN